jgi:stringent starvation protein B
VTDQTPPAMTDRKPYLIKALHEWISDNQMTPHLLVQADLDGVEVPIDYIQNNQITLSIASRSVHDLEIDAQGVRFGATFGGQYYSIVATLDSVLAIFARESGQGMVFSDLKPQPDPDGSEPSETTPKTTNRPSLRVVK